MKLIPIAFSALLLSSLAACQSVPSAVDKPSLDVPYSEEAGWWGAMEDPLLDQLVQAGRISAFDVRRAEAQLDAANAITRAQRAGLMPSLDLAASSVLNETAVTTLGFDLNWQLDVFGAVKSSVRAAEARAGSADAFVDDIQRLVTSEIVASYIQLRARQIERALAEKSAARLEETVEKISRLTSAGYATQLDITRSQRQLANVRARAEALKGAERALQNRIRAVIGSTPEAATLFSSVVDETYAFERPGVPDADADNLFIDRPDIRAAALTLNAEQYEKIAADRSLYPTISLGGNADTSDFGRSILSFQGISTNLVAGVAMPLLGRGRLLAQIDLEDAQIQDALAAYEQTVMLAISEVDTAKNQITATRAAADEQRKAVAAATKALEQSQRLFDAGEINYLDVLFAEQNLIEAEQAQIQTEEAAALSWAQYMTALALN